MGQRRRGPDKPKKLIGRVPLVLLISSMLLSCERNPTPEIPPDNPPKPHGTVAVMQSGIRSAVYSYTGHPMPLYRPETPIPVRRATVRT